jgi:hypothetical protein
MIYPTLNLDTNDYQTLHLETNDYPALHLYANGTAFLLGLYKSRSHYSYPFNNQRDTTITIITDSLNIECVLLNIYEYKISNENLQTILNYLSPIKL